MSTICVVQRLGLIPYQEAWDLQGRLAMEIAEGKRPATLLLLQHPHVYTFGRRGDPANLLWSQKELDSHHVEVLWVDRGGDVTYHGPGQLVGYPLIPLTPLESKNSSLDGSRVAIDTLSKADYLGYLRQLEQVIIDGLASYGVEGKRVDGKTGVWVKPPDSHQINKLAKIAAIGVKVDVHGVTRHGFALNVDPDMSYWNGIIGCGLKDDQSVCLADFLHPVPSMSQVEQTIIDAFQNVFGFQMVNIYPHDLQTA